MKTEYEIDVHFYHDGSGRTETSIYSLFDSSSITFYDDRFTTKSNFLEDLKENIDSLLLNYRIKYSKERIENPIDDYEYLLTNGKRLKRFDFNYDRIYVYYELILDRYFEIYNDEWFNNKIKEHIKNELLKITKVNSFSSNASDW